MWISRKKFEEIKQRIADLEGQVQGQQKVTDYLHVDVSMSPKQVIARAVHEVLAP